MMEFSYEGIGQVVATFANPEGLRPGMVATIVDTNTVGLGNRGDLILGVVLTADADVCAVQVSGFVKVQYSGATTSVGGDRIAVNGGGGVIFGTGDGCYYPVINVDEDSHTAVIKL